jgi:hypothetical protein
MSLKAKDLRVGNCVNNCGQYCFLMAIYKNNKVELGYFKDSIGFIRSLDDVGIKPIPLTEEILLKCGFQKKYKSYEKNDFTFIDGGYDKFAYKLAILAKTPKFLHQLQNLYFALTGEELQINL